MMRENIPAFIEKYRGVSDFGPKWDAIKMEIRTFTVHYSKRKARSEKDKEKQLLIKLNDPQENYVPRGMTLICWTSIIH